MKGGWKQFVYLHRAGREEVQFLVKAVLGEGSDYPKDQRHPVTQPDSWLLSATDGVWPSYEQLQCMDKSM